MYIETLELGRVKTAEKVREYYKIIGTETQRLTNMVDKTLSFSKIERGKRVYKPVICHLNTITEKILETYRFHLNNKDFNLKFSPTHPLPYILGDKEAIADAIINLIDNSIKYSGNNKTIELSTGLEGTGLGLSIVQEIVKAHKGKITLHSKIGAGATFRLYFPILHKSKTRTNDSYTDY